MERVLVIRECQDYPFYAGDERDGHYCRHPKAGKFRDLDSPYIGRIELENPPDWCPIGK